jgi:hypothetical protein
MATAFDRVLLALRNAGKIVRTTGNRAQAQCPAHEDRTPSLTIYGKPGRIKLVCWPGCDDRDVLAALGLSVPDLFDEPKTPLYGTIPPRPFKPLVRPKTRVGRALHNLLELPDIGERICRGIAWQETEESRPDHWWWRATQFHQAGCHDIAQACLRHAAFLAYCTGQPLQDPGVTA